MIKQMFLVFTRMQGGKDVIIGEAFQNAKTEDRVVAALTSLFLNNSLFLKIGRDLCNTPIPKSGLSHKEKQTSLRKGRV